MKRSLDMAETLTIDGENYKKRSPTGVWVLTLVTLVVYWVVWYYKINDEARRYLQDDTIKPRISAIAIFPGCFLLVPMFVSVYRTGQRIERMEQRARITKTVRPVWGPVLTLAGMVTFLLYGGCVFYYQGHLNAIWTATT